MSGNLNLVKLCVGVESVAHLADFQQRRAAQQRADGLPEMQRHVTRMWPRREAELLAGGSLYWVIKGHVQARQKILRLDEMIGEDGIRRCGIVLDPQIILTAAIKKRPFQGWRYLAGADAPRDSGVFDAAMPELPRAMMADLDRLGVL